MITIPINYKITNFGGNYTAFVTEGKKINVTCRNGLGGLIPVSFGPAANAAKVVKLQPVAELNAGTSGLKREGGNAINLGTDKFRFNDKVVLDVAVNGVGLAEQKMFNTDVVTVSLSVDSNIINLPSNDPAVIPLNFTIDYSKAGLGNNVANTGEYVVIVDFYINDGNETPIGWSDGGHAPIGVPDVGAITLDLDSLSSTVLEDVVFDTAALNNGDSVTMITQLTSRVTSFNANVEDTLLLYFEEEVNCIIDEDGVRVTDEDGGNCILDEDGAPPALPLPPAACSAYGSGAISFIKKISVLGPDWFAPYSFTVAQSKANDINNTSVTYGAGYMTVVANSGNDTYLHRLATSFDLSAGGNELQLEVSIGLNNPLIPGERIVFVYRSGDIETGRTNPLYDMQSWSYLGVVDANGTYDIATGGLIPNDSEVWIGMMWERDYQTDFGPYNVDNQILFTALSPIPYRCP